MEQNLDICAYCKDKKGEPCEGLKYCQNGRGLTLAKVYSDINAFGYRLPKGSAEHVSGYQLGIVTAINPVCDMIAVGLPHIPRIELHKVLPGQNEAAVMVAGIVAGAMELKVAEVNREAAR